MHGIPSFSNHSAGGSRMDMIGGRLSIAGIYVIISRWCLETTDWMTGRHLAFKKT